MLLLSLLEEIGTCYYINSRVNKVDDDDDDDYDDEQRTS